MDKEPNFIDFLKSPASFIGKFPIPVWISLIVVIIMGASQNYSLIVVIPTALLFYWLIYVFFGKKNMKEANKNVKK